MPRSVLITFIFLLMSILSRGQDNNKRLEGKVSYVTPQNVYVKFSSTAGILDGDTLYINQGGKYTPVLMVRDLSSTSCVCSSISQAFKPAVSDILCTGNKKTETPLVKSETKPELTSKLLNNDQKDTLPLVRNKFTPNKQLISGRISVSSISDFSNSPAQNSQRLRYTLSLNANNIRNSKLSSECYISFTQKDHEWDSLKNNHFYGFKIYDLSLSYQFSKNSTLSLGRKINSRISNLGAIDGLQFEHSFHAFSTGIISGFRPDISDYSFNSKLMQYGGYISHDIATKKGFFQSTVAFVEQQYSAKTDRRFAYLQHSNMIIPQLSFFGSAEIDLFKKVAETTDNSPRLSNLYLNLRYRILKQLSASISYSERQNILYYESWKENIIDRILQQETQKGYNLQVNYQPFKRLSIGGNAGYRSQKNDLHPSRNFYGYATYSQIPRINVAATLSATILESSYINGKIYSAGLSKDFLKGRLLAELNYNYVDYTYISSSEGLKQNIADLGISWRIYKKLSCSVNYETTIQKDYSLNRLYATISQRF